MEYMLLHDGAVKTFDKVASALEVLAALFDYQGVAYYWYNESVGWCRITPATENSTNTQISDDEVPDIIKLTAMLE